MDELARRSYAALAMLQLALAALIFLPAWSLTYWQGLLYWVLFGMLCAVMSEYFLRHDRALVERRMRGGPAAEKEPRQKLIMWIACAALVAIYLVSAFDYRFGWSKVPASVVLISDALVVLGFYGIFLTLRENAYAAATVTVESGQPVVSTGLYAVVRHPMYATALPAFLATPSALGSWWGLVPAAAFAGALAWRLLDEEAYLARNLPGYADYQRRVRSRLVPGVW